MTGERCSQKEGRTFKGMVKVGMGDEQVTEASSDCSSLSLSLSLS